MAESFFDRVHKQDTHTPDVLSCLANLSNDEVFTPPEVVNQMLDMLPQELFASTETTFLDPACKTGVFLREIAKRLLSFQLPFYQDKMQVINDKKANGLALTVDDEIFLEKLQKTIDHIFHKQLFGIAITELTSLLSRRSLYCSKYPNGPYSITHFDDAEGNIRYRRLKHTWDKSGKCVFCGTSAKGELGENKRGEQLETHAYEWIHTLKPEEIFNMKFDVIISNPPYQLNTAGDDNGAQARPLYHEFIEKAIKLNPHYITMITPSRWFAGGWGLDEFRNKMINSNHIKELHDFQNSSDCFNGVEIKGGISYFLYDRDYQGECDFYSHSGDKVLSKSTRFLKEEGCEILIRYNELISIYRKALSRDFTPFSSIVSGRSPFGFNTNHTGNTSKSSSDDLEYFERKGITFMPKSKVEKNLDIAYKYKLFTPKAAEDGKIPGKVIGNITKGLPNMICSGTYLMIGPFDDDKTMNNILSYMKTKFFRCLVAVNKISQNASYKVYESVPMQDFSKPWTDEELYKKYNLTQEEIDFIESMIRPMDLDGGEIDG